MPNKLPVQYKLVPTLLESFEIVQSRHLCSDCEAASDNQPTPTVQAHSSTCVLRSLRLCSSQAWRCPLNLSSQTPPKSTSCWPSWPNCRHALYARCLCKSTDDPAANCFSDDLRNTKLDPNNMRCHRLCLLVHRYKI